MKVLDVISIIGMACHFPEAKDYSQFWYNIYTNRRSIVDIPKSRFDTDELVQNDPSITCQQAGLIDDIYGFDRKFFNITPNEAKQMDPQQRLALQEAWHCIEDANLPLSKLQSCKTGVFSAEMASDYLQLSIHNKQPIDRYTCLGSYESSLANRISHHFKLSGPSITINTACAGSISALHQARLSLLMGECDYAIVVASNILCHSLKHISFSKAGMLSRTGQCHTFDIMADGYVPGEGVGAVLLTKEKLAEKENLRIYVNILNSGINHNSGAQGLSAPSLAGQACLLKSLYANQDIFANLDYIELHGTGTNLGDPIEFQSLSVALNNRLRKPCYLGSVKANIGHLEAAAGMAGLIKTMLMIKNEKLVPSLTINQLNPLINVAQSKFFLLDKTKEWRYNTSLRRVAGISCFGFGGVNSHVIISDRAAGISKYANVDNQSQLSLPVPLLISSQTEESSDSVLKNWYDYLKNSKLKHKDIGYASMMNRTNLRYRYACLLESEQDIKHFINNENNILTGNIHAPTVILDKFELEECNKKLPMSSTLQNLMRQLKGHNLRKELLYQLTNQLIILDILLNANIDPRLIVVEESARLAFMLYFNLVEPAKLDAMISNQFYEVSFFDMTIPFCLNSSFHVINNDYIEKLLIIPAIKSEQLCYIIKSVIELYQHQYTFKAILSRWQTIMNSEQIELFAGLELLIQRTEVIKGSLIELTKAEYLLVIAILASLRKLKNIWKLTYSIQESIDCDSLNDLLYFLTNNTLTEKNVIDVFCNGSQDQRDQIQSLIKENVTSMKECPLMRSQKFQLNIQSDECSEFDAPDCITHKNVIYIGNNANQIETNHFSKISNSNIEKALVSCLIKQWQFGEDIDWKYLYSNESKKDINLPNYPFNINESFYHNKLN